ncbi:MAG: Wzy polymerase domain-containing protein [Pseudomonadota bacterium]
MLLVLPWLNPFTAGPTPNTWPWLTSAFCVLGLWLLRRQLNAELTASTWVLAATISAAMGLLQYFGLADPFSPWISLTNPGEAYGNLRQRNQFATLTSIGLIALLGLLARQGPGWRVPGWAHLAMVVLALGNAASSSRTGLFQWLLILLLAGWWARPALCGQRRLGVFAAQALLVYGIAVLTLPWLLTALTGLTSGGLFGRLVEVPGCGNRRVLWSNVLMLIAQKPWLGWGWGELANAHFVTLYPGERFCDILDNAHNLPLHLAVELGVPFATVVCAVGLWWVARVKPWRETDPTRQLAWGVLAVIGLHSLLEYPLWYGPFQMAVGLCAWLLWSTQMPGTRMVTQVRPARRTGLFQAVPAITATLLVTTLAFVAWDYWRISQLYFPQADRATVYRDDTLDKVRNSWLFQNQVQFAELTTTPLTAANAAQLNAMARQLLHFSPEPRVVEKLIESAVMLGRNDEALFYLQRFQVAFPQAHASWAKESARHETP